MIASVAADTPQSSRISRKCRPGLDASVIDRPGRREVHITLRPLEGEKLSATLRRLQRVLDAHEAVVVKQDIFGPVVLAKWSIS